MAAPEKLGDRLQRPTVRRHFRDEHDILHSMAGNLDARVGMDWMQEDGCDQEDRNSKRV